MSRKFKAFIEEGMRSYKKASRVAALFRAEVEDILKDIIKQRTDWGPFIKKKMKQPQSSKYWTEYPYINANIEGIYLGETRILRLAINWFDSSGEYPFYAIEFYKNGADIFSSLEAFEWADNVYFNNQLIFEPDPEDYNIKRDFKILIDEFIRFLESFEKNN